MIILSIRKNYIFIQFLICVERWSENHSRNLFFGFKFHLNDIDIYNFQIKTARAQPQGNLG